nr:MAG TPA: hypothetical protein [Caudoviricetes sp.]
MKIRVCRLLFLHEFTRFSCSSNGFISQIFPNFPRLFPNGFPDISQRNNRVISVLPKHEQNIPLLTH